MKNLRASLPATMAGIASKAGLRLAFGQPRTDGKTVWVSDIPLNPTENDYNVVVSDLIHEVGHIKFTDFNLNRGGHPLMPALTNVFEDVRIEKELQAEFLGARGFLDEGYKVIMANGQSRQPDSPANALTMWLLLDYMIKVNGRGFFADSRDMAYQACVQFGTDPALLSEIQALCDTRVSKLSSTADVIQLARDVIELLKSKEKPEEDEDEGNADQGDGNSSSNSQQESQDGSQESNCGADGESDEADSDAEEESNSNSCSKGGAKELLESKVDEKSPLSLRDVAQQIADAVERNNSTLNLVGNTQDLADELRQMNGSGSHSNYYQDTVSPDLDTYNRLKNSVAKDIQVLKTKLVRQWQNESRTRNIVNEHDGRFSVNDAIRCRISGEDNYLVKKTKVVNNKPAVCVLADLSGSMSDNDAITHQTKALIALTEACDLAGIPLNIMGFSSYALTVKKWNDPMPKARAFLGGMNRVIAGTDLPLAVFEGVRALQSRKEQKKILITLTDGNIIDEDETNCRNIMQYAEKSIPNIEFYGLGIGVNLKSLFKKGGRVNPSELSQSLLEILGG